MKLSVVYQPIVSASNSPYRVCDENGGEIEWANAFLDGQRLRQLSPRSLRIYTYDLLDFARWFAPQHRPLAEITEATLVDYVRHQLEQDPSWAVVAPEAFTRSVNTSGGGSIATQAC
jgi:Phage integrase, N-terminal SAM-like domain